MKEELRVVNGVIGMSVGVPGWPSVLRDQGFNLVALEQDVSVRVGRKGVLVRPEAIFFSQAVNQTVVVEAKSATLKEKQAAGYYAMTGDDLVNMGILPAGTDTVGHVVVPIYFTPFGHAEELANTLATVNSREGFDLPLISYSNHDMHLVTGAVRNSHLHTAFDGYLSIKEQYWPSVFVPFDSESAAFELSGVVIQELLMCLMSDSVDRFTARELASGHPSTGSQGCIPFFTQYGSSKRSRFLTRIAEIVEGLRRHYMESYFARSGPVEWVPKRPFSHRSLPTVNGYVQEYRRLLASGGRLPQPRRRDVTGQIDFDEAVPDDSSDDGREFTKDRQGENAL